MSRVMELLKVLKDASGDVPDPEVEPEVVLAMAEQMMELRRAAFEELKGELDQGAALDGEIRVAALELQSVDRAWSKRMEAAMSTLSRRLEGARKLKASMYETRIGGNATLEV